MNYMDDASTFERSLLQKARQKHIPVTGALELLPLCNMNCDMCYVRLSRSEMERQGRLRTVEEWVRLAEQMQKAGTVFLLLTGGEPLLFPDFKTLYRRLRNLGMILTINTNGTLLDEAWADFFATYPPRRINITLYGADAASYDRLCHFPQGFDQTLRAVRLLRARNVDVKISCSVTKKNPQDFSPRKRARCPCSRRSLHDARRPGTLSPLRCTGTPAPRGRCCVGLSGTEAAAGRRYFPAICPGIRPPCQRPCFPAGRRPHFLSCRELLFLYQLAGTAFPLCHAFRAVGAGLRSRLFGSLGNGFRKSPESFT